MLRGEAFQFYRWPKCGTSFVARWLRGEGLAETLGHTHVGASVRPPPDGILLLGTMRDPHSWYLSWLQNIVGSGFSDERLLELVRGRGTMAPSLFHVSGDQIAAECDAMDIGFHTWCLLYMFFPADVRQMRFDEVSEGLPELGYCGALVNQGALRAGMLKALPLVGVTLSGDQVRSLQEQPSYNVSPLRDDRLRPHTISEIEYRDRLVLGRFDFGKDDHWVLGDIGEAVQLDEEWSG